MVRFPVVEKGKLTLKNKLLQLLETYRQELLADEDQGYPAFSGRQAVYEDGLRRVIADLEKILEEKDGPMD